MEIPIVGDVSCVPENLPPKLQLRDTLRKFIVKMFNPNVIFVLRYLKIVEVWILI